MEHGALEKSKSFMKKNIQILQTFYTFYYY